MQADGSVAIGTRATARWFILSARAARDSSARSLVVAGSVLASRAAVGSARTAPGARGQHPVVEQDDRGLGPVTPMPLDLLRGSRPAAAPGPRTGRSPSRRECGPCRRDSGPGSARPSGRGPAAGSRRGRRSTRPDDRRAVEVVNAVVPGECQLGWGRAGSAAACLRGRG